MSVARPDLLRAGMRLFALLFLPWSLAAAELITLNGRAMGTTWSVKFLQPAAPLHRASVERQITDRLEYLEQVFSTYRANSELSRFNATQTTEWVPVAPALARVAVESLSLSELTAGAFDPTVGPLVRLWGFGAAPPATIPPSASSLARARASVGWHHLEARVDPAALRKTDPGVVVDLSSMAKGFAVDTVCDLLTALGAQNHLVRIGGDLRAAGRATDGQEWRAGIEEPCGGGRTVACVVRLGDRALSTSGNYRNYRTGADGRSYGHIIDPRTGQPPNGALAAVSIVHESCATSSGLATGLFVLGADEGYRRAVQHGLACVFFIREGDTDVVRTTSEFVRLTVAAP